MKLGFWGALIFAVVNYPLAGIAQDGCTVSELNTVSHMPPARSQDSVGFCYAFSAVGLIQQFYCKHRESGCSYSAGAALKQPQALNTLRPDGSDLALQPAHDDRLSVLDAMAVAREGKLVEIGIEEAVLKAVRRNGSLALEKCAPFDNLIQSDFSSSHQDFNSSWWERLKILHADYQSTIARSETLSPEERFAAECKVAVKVKQSANLLTEISQIVEALRRKEFNVFVKKAVIPDECAKSRVKLPDFKIKSMKSHDPDDTGPKLQSLINKGIPAGISLCSWAEAEPGKSCGPHAVVVSGSRKKCCDGKCRFQYRIYDSADVFWAKAERDDYFDIWVDRDVVLERIELLGKRRSSGVSIRWVEDP